MATNREKLIELLQDIDNFTPEKEDEINKYINCPYTQDYPYTPCNDYISTTRDMCVSCKILWLKSDL